MNTDQLARTWGTAIRTHRLDAGLTQRDLGDRVGVNDAAVSQWERGVTVPSTVNRIKVALALGLDPVDLFPYFVGDGGDRPVPDEPTPEPSNA